LCWNKRQAVKVSKIGWVFILTSIGYQLLDPRREPIPNVNKGDRLSSKSRKQELEIHPLTRAYSLQSLVGFFGRS
jgi:hypothetical protein